MAMSNFWSRIFGKEEGQESKNVAKERLRLVLVHDRLDMSDQVMHNLRHDLIEVINKYMEIDVAGLDVSLTKEEDGMALVANIPILNVRREEKKEEKPVPAANAANAANNSQKSNNQKKPNRK